MSDGENAKCFGRETSGSKLFLIEEFKPNQFYFSMSVGELKVLLATHLTRESSN